MDEIVTRCKIIAIIVLLLNWSDNNDYLQCLKEQNEIDLNSEGWCFVSHDIQLLSAIILQFFPGKW